MDFFDITNQWLPRVEAKLDAVLPPAETSPGLLHTAMRYSVLGGGKRIRPILVYATGEALDAPRLMLHATELRLRHPEGGRGMRFVSKPPF